MRSYRNTKSLGHCCFLLLCLSLSLHKNYGHCAASVLKMKRRTTNQKSNNNSNRNTATAPATDAATCQSFTENWQICEIYSTHSTLNHWPQFCIRPNLFNSLFSHSFHSKIEKQKKNPQRKKACVRSRSASKRVRDRESYGKKSHPFKTCTTLI